MKKQTYFILHIITFLLGFFPWITDDGHQYGAIGVIWHAIDGTLTPNGGAPALIVWGIAALAFLAYYPPLLMKYRRGEDVTSLEYAGIILTFAGTIFLYCILMAVFSVIGVDDYGFVPWQVLRVFLYIFLYMDERYHFVGKSRQGSSAYSGNEVPVPGTDTAGDAPCAAGQLQNDPNVVMAAAKTDHPRSSHERRRAPSAPLRLLTSAGMVLVILLFPWFNFGERTYSAVSFFLAVRSAGGAASFLAAFQEDAGYAYWLSAADLTLVYDAIVIVLLMAICCFARIILIAAKRRHGLVTALLYGCAMVYICLFGLFANPDAGIALMLTYALVLVDLVAGKYLDDRKELLRKAEETREKTRAEKEEKQRRVYFAGRYDSEFFRIIGKNFLYNRKSYVLFLIAATGIVTLLYALTGILLSYRASDANADPHYTGALQTIATGVLPILAFSAVLLLALIITHYIRTRMRNYSVYQALGTRKSTMQHIIAFEFLTCVVAALLLGTLLGAFAIHRFRTPGPLTFGATFGIYAGVLLVAVLINYHRFEYSNIFRLGAEVDEEGRPHGLFIAGILPGALLIAFAVFNRNRIHAAENFASTLYLCAGVFLFGFGLLGWMTEWRSREAVNHGQQLLRILPWRYRFRSNFRMFYLLFILQFLALGVFLPELSAVRIAPDAETLFPYDFVCPTYPEDEAVFCELEAEGASVQELRMLRATTPLGSPLRFGDYFSNPLLHVQWPQGRHIVLAESDYRTLCRDAGITPAPVPEAEDGLGMHILFQQDLTVRGHTLDYLSGSGYQIRIGQPLLSYDPMTRDRIYRPRTVTTERAILTGMLRQGQMENIIVISDDWFDRIYSGWTDDEANADVAVPVAPAEIREGPSILRLVNCRPEEEPRIREMLSTLDDAHREDLQYDTIVRTVYAKSELLEGVSHDRTSALIAYAATVLVSMISALFLFRIKFGLEGDEASARYLLLSQLGMRRSDQRKLLLREILPILFGSYLTAAAFTVICVLAIIHLRWMDAAETAAFLRRFLTLAAAYTGIYMSVTALQIGRFIHVSSH